MCVSSGFGHLCALEPRTVLDHSSQKSLLTNNSGDEKSNGTLLSSGSCHYRDKDARTRQETSHWPLANV